MYSEQEMIDIATVFDALNEIFPNQALSQKAVKFYASLFYRAGLSVDDIRTAVADMMNSAKFYPKPGEIIQTAQGGTKEEQAARSWALLLDSLEHPSVSSYRPVVFDDGRINWTVNRMGGIGLFLTARPEQLQQFWYEFKRLFAIADKDPCIEPRKTLNPSKKRPVLIGDQEKCLLLLETAKPEVKGFLPKLAVKVLK